MSDPRFLNQSIELIRIEVLRNLVHTSAEAFQDLATALQVGFESIQSFMEPAREHFLSTAEDEWNVDLNLCRLPDAIETADTLFKKFRIERKIEENEMMRKLKIPAFTANLRTNQNAGATLIRKPGGIAIALNKRQSLVEDTQLQLFDSLPQRSLDGHNFCLGSTDQKNLFR